MTTGATKEDVRLRTLKGMLDQWGVTHKDLPGVGLMVSGGDLEYLLYIRGLGEQLVIDEATKDARIISPKSAQPVELQLHFANGLGWCYPIDELRWRLQ